MQNGKMGLSSLISNWEESLLDESDEEGRAIVDRSKKYVSAGGGGRKTSFEIKDYN